MMKSDFLTKDEFYNGFCSFFDFSSDVTKINALRINKDNVFEEKGAKATAGRLYEICTRYDWLNFIVQRDSQWLADMALIAGFVAIKTNAVTKEVTGYDLKKGVKLWLKQKTQSNRRRGWGFLARRAAEKQPKQEN
jgi:hypothetical protein